MVETIAVIKLMIMVLLLMIIIMTIIRSDVPKMR